MKPHFAPITVPLYVKAWTVRDLTNAVKIDSLSGEKYSLLRKRKIMKTITFKMPDDRFGSKEFFHVRVDL